MRRNASRVSKSGATLRGAAIASALVACASIAIGACRTATQVTVVVRTNLAFRDAAHPDGRHVSVGIAASGGADAETQSFATTIDPIWGDDGLIGTVAFTPAAEDDGPLNIRVVMAIDRPLESCVIGSAQGTDGCYVARRQLGYLPHTALSVPLVVWVDCNGQLCTSTTTCNRAGACVSAAVPKAACAEASGCVIQGDPSPDEPLSLVSERDAASDALSATDAGEARDAGTGGDAAADAGVDAAADAGGDGGGAGTILLFHFDGTNGSTTFTDVSGFGHTATRIGNPQISTAQSKFGGASLYINGNASGQTNYVSVTASDLVLTGDFTVDYWYYAISYTNTFGLFAGNFSLAQPGCSANLDCAYASWNTSGANTHFKDYPGSIVTATAPVTGAWHHVAHTRSGTMTRNFVDGTLRYSGSGAALAIGGKVFFSGGGSAADNGDLKGYIDEFRIVKGSAVWTSNFTPPTQPY